MATASDHQPHAVRHSRRPAIADFWRAGNHQEPQAAPLRRTARNLPLPLSIRRHRPVIYMNFRPLRSHRGGQGFKSPQLHPEPQVAALFRSYFRLSILAPSLSWERAGAVSVRPTSLTSGDVLLFVTRVGAVLSQGRTLHLARLPLLGCSSPLTAPRTAQSCRRCASGRMAS